MISIVSVNGNSMRPTLQNGERLLAYTPLTKRWFTRNMVVTLRHDGIQITREYQVHRAVSAGYGHADLFIKRIVGLPDDIVRIPINQLSEQILPMIDPHGVRLVDEYYWRIAKGHVFVRGDATFSIDSVVWGPIPITQVQQIILCRFPSFQRI